MKTSIDLFQLIKSLTKSEKRYFKLTARSQKAKGGSNYLKLFEAIEKQQVYDEELIKKKFSGSAFIKHLPSEKNYLYTLIEKSLVKFHASSSDEIELDDHLHAAEIFFKKGLYLQSSKALEKALSLALESELYSKLFKISELQLQLIPQVALSAESMKEKYTRSLENVRLAFRMLENQARYNELHSDFYQLIRKEGELARSAAERLRLENIMLDPLLQDESHALTKSSRRLFYFIHATYHHVTGNPEKAYHFEEREVAQMESDKKMMTDSSLIYTARVSNMCETSLRMKNYSLCKKNLEKLRNAPAAYPLEKARLFYRYYDFALRLQVMTGEFDKAVALVKPIESGFARYKENIHKSRQISLYYHFAYAYFGNGDYKASLGWINRVLEEKTDLRSDLLCYARLLNCIVHFELKNYLQLESAYKSTQYFFSKRKKLYQFEATFLKYFRKVCNAPGSKTEKNVLTDFNNELLALLKDPRESAALEYFDLPSWLESRIEKRLFAEIIKRKINAPQDRKAGGSYSGDVSFL